MLVLLSRLDNHTPWLVDLVWGTYAFVLGIGFEILPAMNYVVVPAGEGVQTNIIANLQAFSMLGLFAATFCFPFAREIEQVHAVFWIGGSIAAVLGIACHFLMDNNAPTGVLKQDIQQNLAMKVLKR